MARCVRCGKDTGWFGKVYCSEEKPYKYGDKLRIKSGFCKGQEGILIMRYDCGWKRTWDYAIKLADGKIVDCLDEYDVELITK